MKIPTWIYVLVFILAIATACVGTNVWLHGNAHVAYCLFVFFLASNVLVCIWVICLYAHRDYVQERVDYWEQTGTTTGRTPAINYLNSRISIAEAFTTKQWADAWAVYSIYDRSYVDRRSYGFIVDIGNGFVTLLPTLFLLFAYTVKFRPAIVVGIVGLMVSWQWIHATAMYIASFFIAQRQKLIPKLQTNILIWGINTAWILFGLLGGYVSVRLIIENNYTVFGT